MDGVEAWFDQHFVAVWRYLARRAGRAAADDLAQEVFVRAVGARDRFDPGRGGPRPWLYGIAANVLRQSGRADLRASAAYDRLARQPVAPVEDPADAAARGDAFAAAMDAVAALDRGDQELLLLAVWEELSYAEIAEATGIPVGTVKSRLSRLRARLREPAGSVGEEPG